MLYIVLYKVVIDIFIEEVGWFLFLGLCFYFIDYNLMFFINEICNLG